MGAFMDSIGQLAYSLSKNGFGKSMAYNATDVARSAVYNKVASAMHKVMGEMTDEAAAATRKSIKTGTFNFQSDDIDNAVQKMMAGSDEAKKAAEEFTKLSQQYVAAYDAHKLGAFTSAEAFEAYTSILGRENGALKVTDAIGGYLGDKQLGAFRRRTLAGAAVGASVATRFLSGGSLTRTASGESDIAGIPFF